MEGWSHRGDSSGSPHTCQYLLCRPLQSLRVLQNTRIYCPVSLVLTGLAATENVPDSLGSLCLVTDQLDWEVSLLMIVRGEGSGLAQINFDNSQVEPPRPHLPAPRRDRSQTWT